MTHTTTSITAADNVFLNNTTCITTANDIWQTKKWHNLHQILSDFYQAKEMQSCFIWARQERVVANILLARKTLRLIVDQSQHEGTTTININMAGSKNICIRRIHQCQEQRIIGHWSSLADSSTSVAGDLMFWARSWWLASREGMAMINMMTGSLETQQN